MADAGRVAAPKVATFTYEQEFKRMDEIMRPALFQALKKYPLPLDEFDKLVNMVCGVGAQHYREGAYHGDIDAREEVGDATRK